MIPSPEAPDSQFEARCGAEFARGQHRIVHHVIAHPELVIKVDNNTTFANWNEYLISDALNGRPEPVAKLIGSVVSISATGKYLVMERLKDIDGPLSGIQYPVWLNDFFKRSAYGLAPSGAVKVRDFGTLKLADVLARHNPLPEGEPAPKIVPGGYDEDYAVLQGAQVAMDAGRAVHEVIGHPNHVLKVCGGSHKANRIELLVYSALVDMNADEREQFGILECSRSGKYLLMERLQNLPTDFTGSRPQFPWWLIDQSDTCVGITPEGNAKIRSFSEIRLGDVLARPALKRFA